MHLAKPLGVRKGKGKSQKTLLSLALLSIGLISLLCSVRVLFWKVDDGSSSPSSQWQPDNNNNPSNGDPAAMAINTLKLPTPILVTSLPKSGTTSIWKYFSCGLGKGQAAHQYGKIKNGTEQVRLGKCFLQNIQQKRPMLEGCGDYKIWTDAGFIAPGVCFYPSIHGGLQAFYDSYPQATILNIVRETESWLNSSAAFNNLWERWSDKCEMFPPPGSQRKDFATFYNWHTKMVRDFAHQHPSMTYVELPLEGPDMPKRMEETTGINASCWLNSRTMKGKFPRPYLKKLREMKKMAKLAEETNKIGN